MGNGFRKAACRPGGNRRRSVKLVLIPCLKSTDMQSNRDTNDIMVRPDGRSKGVLKSGRGNSGSKNTSGAADPIPSVPESPPLSSFEQLLSRLRTTEEQIDIIIDMWKRARAKGPNQPGAAILAHIVISNPSLKNLFYQDQQGRELYFEDFDMSIHARRFTAALDDVIMNIKNPSMVDIKLRSLGARHVSARSLGFQTEYWKTFAQALITQTLDWGTTASFQSFQTRHVWVKLVGEILRIMKEGYTAELARRERKEAARDYQTESTVTDPLMKSIG